MPVRAPVRFGILTLAILAIFGCSSKKKEVPADTAQKSGQKSATLASLALWTDIHSTATDQQIDKLIALLHSKDIGTVQLTLEFVRGSEYMDDLRIQAAVLDHWEDGFGDLAADMIAEIKSVPPATVELLFTKALAGESSGGFHDSGRRRAQAAFEKWTFEDYSLFRRLLERTVAIVGSAKYPNYSAEVSGFFFKTFRNLGKQASVLEQLDLLQGILAKCDPKLQRDIAESLGVAFVPFRPEEESALYDLFLKSDPKLGATKENEAYWILSTAKNFTISTMAKLRDTALSGPEPLRESSLRMVLNAIDAKNPAHAEFLLDFVKRPEVTDSAKSDLFYAIGRFELSGNAMARRVLDMALDYALVGKYPGSAMDIVFRSWVIWTEADFQRTLSLAGHSDSSGKIRRNKIALKLDWLQKVLPFLASQNANERATAMAFLDPALDARLYDFEHAEQATIALMNFTRDACASTNAADVIAFCAAKMKASSEYFVISLMRAPPAVSLRLMRDDAVKALHSDQIRYGGDSSGYWSLDFLDKVKRTPDLKWTLDDFLATWVSFVTDQIESGDPLVLRNSWTFFSRMSYITEPGNKNPLWNIDIGDNQRLVSLLKNFLVSGSSVVAEQADMILGSLFDRAPVGTLALQRWYLDRLRDGSPQLVRLILRNPWYVKSYEPSDVDLIVSFAKGKDPGLRGSAFSMLAYPYVKPKSMSGALGGLVLDAQKSLQSPELEERAWAIGLAELGDESLKRQIFTPEVVANALQYLVGAKELFLQPGGPGSIGYDYFVNAARYFLKIRLGMLSPDNYPAGMMRELIWAPNHQIAREAIIGIGYYFAALAEKRPTKRYGVVRGVGEVTVPKDLLDELARLAARENSGDLRYFINISVTKTRDKFDIEKYISGSIMVDWEN